MDYTRYIYCRLLIKALALEPIKDVDIFDKISFERFVQIKTGEYLDIKLEANGEINHSVGISNAKPDEKLDTLSHIINELNEAFGFELGKSEKLSILQTEEILKQNNDLKIQANNNTIDNFALGFKDSFVDSMVEGLTRNEKFFEMVLTNDAMKNKLMELLLNRIYESFVSKK